METNERNQEETRAKAREKLEAELKAEKNRIYAEPIILHMIKRCEEDAGLAEDVLQEHKTFKKCFDHIYAEARKQADSSRVAYVIDSVVYEWAEDYYRMDDKAAGAKKQAEDEKGGKDKAESRKEAPKPDAGQAEESAEAQETGEGKPEEESVETPGLAEEKAAEERAPDTPEPTEKGQEESGEKPKTAKKKRADKAEKAAEPARGKAGKAAGSLGQEAGKQGKAKQKKPNPGREMEGQMDLLSLLGMQEAEDAE
ncbi:MAG: Cas9 inhibitor AcrIIA9 family protein [Akkermansia sp.]|nr:Cas9 inhibitor AcrIIA9 family protein [Akkermansia sp.]